MVDSFPRRLTRSALRRCVAACADEAKTRVKSAAIQAGVRELLTINSVMAAAVGAGMAVEAPDFKAVFILERDWCSFGLISLAGMVASFDLAGGVELLLEDFALHTLATRGVALDLEALHTSFLARGLSGAELLGWDAWIGELETGRATVLAANGIEVRPTDLASQYFGHSVSSRGRPSSASSFSSTGSSFRHSSMRRVFCREPSFASTAASMAWSACRS